MFIWFWNNYFDDSLHASDVRERKILTGMSMIVAHAVWGGGEMERNHYTRFWQVAQLVEQEAVNFTVVGAKPTLSAI